MEKTTNVTVAGLGGQGVLTVTDILAEVLFRAGFDVKKSEVHGMSQRGGSVSSEVRFGKAVASPMVPEGESDYLIVMEPTQVEVNQYKLRPGGVLITTADVPTEKLKNPKALNTMMLGALSALTRSLGVIVCGVIWLQSWRQAVHARKGRARLAVRGTLLGLLVFSGLGAYLYLNYHVSGGLFWRPKSIYFADFRYFTRRNFPDTWDDQIGGVFNLLAGEWFNASDKYVQAHVMYESPFVLFKFLRVNSTRKFLRVASRYILSERFYLSQLWTPVLPSYTEIGYGIGNHIFNIALFAGFDRWRYDGIGVKFAFELFQ